MTQDTPKRYITRFAPSPTGRLHLGHAYSAIFAHNRARDTDGRFILRIEDIDPTRCTPAFEQGIYDDLSWLGLKWEKPPRRQSDHMADYGTALSRLRDLELLYPCFCSRKDIQEEIARSGYAPHLTVEGPEGLLYPGTCRHLSPAQQIENMERGLPYAFRLDMNKALAMIKASGNADALRWYDHAQGWQNGTPGILGDVVLARKDVPTSYHLSVVVDDHLQGVTLVTRGRDLFYATHLHRLLQALLGLRVPEYHHHELMLDPAGKRFAKRNDSVTLQHLREVDKKTPADILQMIGLKLLSATAALLFIITPAHATGPVSEEVQEQTAQPAPGTTPDSTQDTAQETTLEQNVTRHIIRNDKKSYLTFSYENDRIGSGNDSDYTNGVRITYYDTQAAVPEIIHKIAAPIPTFSINQTTSVYYTLGQNLYTPSDITIRAAQPDDRPWAAWLYMSAGLTTITGNHADDVELTAGVVGPAAAGEPVQRVVHNLINVDLPRGWDNQLENEPGLMASWNRRWPDALEAKLGPLHFGIEPHVGVTAGNIYLYGNTGATLTIGPYHDGPQDSPPRVRPAVPGTGYFGTPDDEFSWYLFAGVEGRAVGRNIFLDGNTFRDSPRVDKKYLVGDATVGAALTWDDVRLSYNLTYRTEEYHGQDENTLFGGISVGFRY